MLVSRLIYFAVALSAQLAGTAALADEWVTEGRKFDVDVSRVDGRIAIDLLGTIWVVPASGGQATALSDGLEQASRPRWSPDGERILYQVRDATGTSLRTLDVGSGSTTSVNTTATGDQLASWHSGGERIVFSSTRGDIDFDIWEIDLPTGLSWRLVNGPGDELEPVWSADGDDLAYIEAHDDQYRVMVRRRGRRAEAVHTTTDPLSNIAWRPDGTLLTVLRDTGTSLTAEMIILSDPPLVREFAVDEQLEPSPITWLDRSKHYYVANGAIKTRAFGERSSRSLPFRALVTPPEPPPLRDVAQRELTVTDAPAERLVIRGARLFDGIWAGYRDNMDVLIEAGKIVAIESRREWDNATVLDLGDVTIMPGFVDAWSRMPSTTDAIAGARFLSYGVTTVVSDQAASTLDESIWDSELTPGPRLLRASSPDTDLVRDEARDYFLAFIPSGTNQPSELIDKLRTWRGHGLPVAANDWKTFLGAAADVLLGVHSLPHLSFDFRYTTSPDVMENSPSRRTTVVISAMADAGTPGIEALKRSRQAQRYGQIILPTHRQSLYTGTEISEITMLVGSANNRLPPGLATHAEFRALQALGLGGEQIFHAAGKNIAQTLGIGNQVGTLSPGALADMVLVQGDPLGDVNDAINIVAVVRNGRFFSLVSLLEMASDARNVE